jgi:hypothetical protein
MALVRVLERVLVLERFERCTDPQERRSLLRSFRPSLARGGALEARPLDVSVGPDSPPIAASNTEESTADEGRAARRETVNENSRSEAGATGSLGGAEGRKARAEGESQCQTLASRGPLAPGVPARSASPGKSTERRRPRAAHPVWSPDEGGEKRETFGHVGAILELANHEFGATFDVEHSRRDTLLYPYEVVRGAVANVLLKKARGYRFENPGAVLWDAITLPAYRLEEFAVANLEEVLKRCSGTWTSPECSAPVPPLAPPERELAPSDGGDSFVQGERRRAEARRAVHERLLAHVREDLDRRARELALDGFKGRGLPLDEPLLALRILRARDDLLEREHAQELEEAVGREQGTASSCPG